MRRCIFFISIFIVTQCAFAELRWEGTSVLRYLGAFDGTLTTKFSFKNSGKNSVTVNVLEPDCKCITYGLEKTIYAPGESGELIVHFSIGSRQGTQAQSIKVQESGSTAPTILTIKAVIPPLLEFDPRYVSWSIGERALDKEIAINVSLVEAAEIIEVSSSTEKIRTKLVEGESRKKFKLVLAPTSTDGPIRARISLLVRHSDGREKRIYAYAFVK